MSVEFSEGLTKRLHILQDYQEKLIEEFGEDDYNVFIFGSFPTEDYIEGQSDIDVAIYCDNLSKYVEICAFTENYFGELNIRYDIICIDTDYVAYIYYIPLKSVIRITDYYPDSLKEFCDKCKAAYEIALEKGKR